MTHRVIAALALSLAGCIHQSEWPMPMPPEMRRCTGDGLCLTVVSDRVLSGAFRRGDRELSFDSVWRGYEMQDPSAGWLLRQKTLDCSRISISTGAIIWHERGLACPQEWDDPERNGPVVGLRQWAEMAVEMAVRMQAQGAPTVRWVQAWEDVLGGVQAVAAVAADPA